MKFAHFYFKADPKKVIFHEKEIEMSEKEGVKACQIVERVPISPTFTSSLFV